MTSPFRKTSTALLAASCAWSLCLPAASAFSLYDGEDLQLGLQGYVQSAGGFQDPGYEVPVVGSTASGFNAQVLRLQWTAQWQQSLVLEVHNRFFSHISTAQAGLDTGSILGLGASVTPARTLDLSATLIDKNGFLFSHDIDRLALRAYWSGGEVIAGRQAITWGKSTLFQIADVWTQFSPFELDQTEKAGTDALRVLYYPTHNLTLDFVVADRGRIEDLSAGVRASLTAGMADMYLAGGKFWNEIHAMAGITYDLTSMTLRAEITDAYNLDTSDFKLPRATLGADYLSNDWSFTAEYHFNGIRAASSNDYLEQLNTPEFTRGQAYYLGRHYAGAAASFGAIDRLRISLGAVMNLTDPSAILSPSLVYELSDNSDITLGAFQGIGKQPTFALPITDSELGSEFGTYGGFYFTQFRGFF